ncbi:hypothetical protein M0802_015434 [Mischocyttarus mexicanus]|nr:hypothetical protein M0802_015434 [Mischocyttarus mexicanus]
MFLSMDSIEENEEKGREWGNQVGAIVGCGSRFGGRGRRGGGSGNGKKGKGCPYLHSYIQNVPKAYFPCEKRIRAVRSVGDGDGYGSSSGSGSGSGGGTWWLLKSR